MALRPLLVHNYYQQPGGEDQVFAAESALLEERHPVIRYEEDNARITNRNAPGAAMNAVWSWRSARSLGAVVERHKPDVVHFHNTFPLISPAAYYAARREGAAVVQTLHNYRLLCPGATLFREGAVCEECISRNSLWPAISHSCYRESRPATITVATMLSVHRAAGTWRRKVDLYIALSEFARQKFIEGGVPGDRIAVKPNFVSPDPGRGEGRGGYALFAGRLSAEKGISVLASGWRELADIPLVVAGDGPLAGALENSIHRLKPVPPLAAHGAALLGQQPREKVLALMQQAHVLIFPSVCYETGPLTILEAFACGLPVIASNLGSMAELVTHERTGLLFHPGDAADLARKVRWAFDHPEAMEKMRGAARREFEEKYTAERNYKMLIGIYQEAIENSRRPAAVGSGASEARA